jgi:thymidylate synthase (FAD)
MNQNSTDSDNNNTKSVPDTSFPVLNDGFIRVVDTMGTDESIVQAARVSYGKGTKKSREDRMLIRYLMRMGHTSPFEMCEIKFHIRVPMDTWRQWIRHRTANVNEYSTRYSIAIDQAQTTDTDGWREQSKANHQGSGDFLPGEIGEALTREETEIQKRARDIYNQRIERGVAREQARKDLPLSTYTEAYWKIDLHNLLHFLGLRMDSHAQKEIRAYATIIGNEIVAKWVPMTWQAFLDYRVNSLRLSARDLDIVKTINTAGPEEALKKLESFRWVKKDVDGWKLILECTELETKLIKLGLPIPWE